MFLKIFIITVLLTTLFVNVRCMQCTPVEALVTGNVENEGFHKYVNGFLLSYCNCLVFRNIKWLVEIGSKGLSSCKVAIRQDVPAGLYVNPDQIADLNRVGKVSNGRRGKTIYQALVFRCLRISTELLT